MEPLLALFWVSITLSVASFVIFAAFAAQRYREVQRIAKEALQERPLKQAGMDTGLQGLPDADKVLEALAKLTDALSKAPMSVAALIAAMFFMLVALGASALEGRIDKKGSSVVKTSLVTPATHCVVGYFGDGDHRLPSVIQDSPRGGLNQLAERMRREQPGLLLLIGRCDLRELKPEIRKTYANNLSLAYQRALSAGQYILGAKPGSWPAASDEMTQRAVLLAAGASHIGSRVDAGLLREDRVVELISFWVQLNALP